jgi:hypothetical protein
VTLEDLEECGTIEEEFSKVKKTYFKKVLVCHPDKGGDSDTFRLIQTSFETLRDMWSAGKITSFVAFLKSRKNRPKKSKGPAKAQSSSASEGPESFDFAEFAHAYNERFNEFDSFRQPDFDYFERAQHEEMPKYRVERAKTGRAKCTQKQQVRKPIAKWHGEGNEDIEKESVKCMSYDSETGTYWRPVHLDCWRIPNIIWKGLPDPDTCKNVQDFLYALRSMDGVVLSGWAEVGPEAQAEIAVHCMDRANYTADRGPKLMLKEEAEEYTGPPPKARETAVVAVPARIKQQYASSSSSSSSSSRSSSGGGGAVVNRERVAFVAPVAGKTAPAGSLAGKTIVMTGVFPEIGGGGGLSLGKDRLKAILTSFGARVTSSISGKTDILIVGSSPGFSKVSSARNLGVAMWDTKEMQERLEGGKEAVNAAENEPMLITSFSAGYTKRVGGSNSLALKASDDQMAIAAGVKHAPLLLKKARSPQAARKRVKKSHEEYDDYDVDDLSYVPRPPPAGEFVEVTTETISCDLCDADCTKSSYFVKGVRGKEDMDVCVLCFEQSPKLTAAAKKKALRQAFGKDVVEESTAVAVIAPPRGRGRPKRKLD